MLQWGLTEQSASAASRLSASFRADGILFSIICYLQLKQTTWASVPGGHNISPHRRKAPNVSSNFIRHIMQDEKIIRQEAQEFHRDEIEGPGRYYAIEDIHELKSRLYDFYSPESKAIFLDEIEKQISTRLQEHRDSAHGGKPGENCQHEKKPEKLLFYIKQELETLPIVAHQKNKSNPAQKREKVFVSYSHLDKDYLSDIQRHFKPFLNQIDFWDDTKILPGQKWKDEIQNAINKCKVAILLISTDFLGSDFIATDELPPLLKAAEENGAVILIVILKPCLFEDFETLNQYQAMNPPSKPVIKMDYSEKEELYVNLVRQTKRILKGE